MPEVSRHLRSGVFAGAQGQHVTDFHLLIGPIVVQHGVDQGLGFPHTVGQGNPVSGVNILHCLLGCDEFCHNHSPSCCPAEAPPHPHLQYNGLKGECKTRNLETRYQEN